MARNDINLNDWSKHFDESNLFVQGGTPTEGDGVSTCVLNKLGRLAFSSAKVADEFRGDAYTGEEPFELLALHPEASSSPGLDPNPSNHPKLIDVLGEFGISPDDWTTPTDQFNEDEEFDLREPLAKIINLLCDADIKDKVAAKIEHGDDKRNRNGLWIMPHQQDTLAITLSLDFSVILEEVVDFGEEIIQMLNDRFGLKKFDNLSFGGDSKLKVRIKSRNLISKTEDNDGNDVWTSDTLYEFVFRMPLFGLLVNFRISYIGEFEFSISENPDDSTKIFTKIAKLIDQDISEDQADPREDDDFSMTASLWNLAVTRIDKSFQWSIGFLVQLNLKTQEEWPALTIALTYESSSGTFTGQLLFRDQYSIPSLDVDFNEIWDVPDAFYASMTSNFDFREIREFESLPDSFPTKLIDAFFEYTKGSPSELLMSATLVSRDNVDNTADVGHEVPFPFEWTAISLFFAKAGSQLDMEMITQFQLNPPDPKFETGLLDLRFGYSSGSWQLSGRAENIQIASIVDWFDKDMKDEVMDVLGKLKIVYVDLTYTFQITGKKQKASHFVFEGLVEMGELQLALSYEYGKNIGGATGNSTGWEFKAFLDTPQPGATVADIAESIVDGAADELPPFVGDIQVKSDDVGEKLISLVAKKRSHANIQRVVFLLNVSIADVEFTFAQVSSKTSTKTAIKRLLRFAVDKIPLLSNLPVVKELPQPFDELQYMWSQKDGLARTEVEALNILLGELGGEQNKLMFKATTKGSIDPNSQKDPIVLAEGHHFVVVNDSRAVLDHVFKPKKKEGSTKATLAHPVQARLVAPTNDGSKPSKGALTKATQFITIKGLTFEYKEDRLWITVDGTVVLGPLEFSLLGFGIGLNLAGIKLNKLELEKLDPKFKLRGMAASFDRPPVLIAGTFEVDQRIGPDGEEIKSYRGGVGVGIPPYVFVAVGEYAEVTKDKGTADEEIFKSVFIYAKLDGPLIDFQFAILRGVRIGFGYNSLIRSPSVSELHQFPLISDNSAAGTGNNPMNILQNMRGGDDPWIQLKNKSYWLAFGLTISSFNIINCTAVALVSFRSNGVIFSLFGQIICTLPPNLNADPPIKIFYVEILMNAELNFVEDCFKLQAALAPSSFLLVPMARLRGGFALYTFFGRNPHAGDWVFSLGGYHRKFAVPSHYPRPERLGLEFSIGIISIEGKGYFALTPKAVMAGAFIHCELNIGPVFAYLDAAFDAMVQFEPVHYWVDMHVEIGVECRIRLLFVTIHIAISIGAQLHIEGPEFGGTAHVDFWFFSFDIEFGKQPTPPDPLTLGEFFDVVAKAGPEEAPNGRTSPPEGLVLELKFTLEDGAFPMPTEDAKRDAHGNPVSIKDPTSTGAGAKWFVKGGSFKFRVASVFAISEAWVETEDSGEGEWDEESGEYAHPLPEQEGKGNMLSVDNNNGSAPIGTLSARLMNVSQDITAPLYVAIRDADTPIRVTEGWATEYVVQDMPKQVWFDPKQELNALSREKGTMKLCMGVVFSAPRPVLAISKIKPINATDMSKFMVAHRDLPEHEPEQKVLLPAAREDGPQTWPDMEGTWAGTESLWDAGSTTEEPEKPTGLARAMMDACVKVLKWDKPSPETLAKVDLEGGDLPWDLAEAKFPKRLVTGGETVGGEVMDGFENYYLELPRVVDV